jgi:molybdopterin-guanine dinucleotide biosynthesis protein A
MTKQYTRKSANILLEAADLQERKGQDYQNPLSRVRQADHYPRGVYTILDTINGKMLRMYSVLETMEQGGKVNFESVEDSAIDMINYASFLVAYMRGEIDGQEMGKDIFNRRTSKQTHPTTALYPTKFRAIQKEPTANAIGPFEGVVAQEDAVGKYVPTGRFEE